MWMNGCGWGMMHVDGAPIVNSGAYRVFMP